MTFPTWVRDDWTKKTLVVAPPLGLEDPCWLWTGARTPDGYGRVNVGGRSGEQWYLHRYSWTQHNGRRLLPGHDGAHQCDRRSCWQPTHIMEQTAGANRAASSAIRYAREALTPDDLTALADAHWITIASAAAFR